MRRQVDALRDFLYEAAYSGSSWERGASPAEHQAADLGVPPSVIGLEANQCAEVFTRRAARELWGRGAPKE
jgi:hypothetical protein